MSRLSNVYNLIRKVQLLYEIQNFLFCLTINKLTILLQLIFIQNIFFTNDKK
jgi:hypothetical protein